MTKRSLIREKTGVTGLKSAILVNGLTLEAGVMTACFQVLGNRYGPGVGYTTKLHLML